MNNENKKLLEIGCGVGNFIFPLLKLNKSLFVYACDFSNDAIQLLKGNQEYDDSRLHGFVCDLTKPNSIKDSLPEGLKVDFVTLIFVMSAIHPKKFKIAVENISQVIDLLFLFIYYTYENHPMGAMKNKFKKLKEKRKEELYMVI